MLAERAPLAALLATAGLAALSLAPRPTCERPRPPTCTLLEARVAAPTAPACPASALAATKLEAPVAVYCARGFFPQPGTLVRAFYRTSELWERILIVDDHGALMQPMIDQPSLLAEPAPIFADDIERLASYVTPE
ncbi:MAG TPA: hypothetical protein VK427_22875 [Kofleriaceae bacterium]|nr:hypothetical protein [Kofleriaceae bacterium]